MSIPGGVLLESDTICPSDQLRQRWENLNKDQSTKLQLSLNSLEQDQLSSVHSPFIMHIIIDMIVLLISSLLFRFLHSHELLFLTYDFCNDTCLQVLLRSRLSSPSMVFKGEIAGQDSRSPCALFEACTQTLQRITQDVKHRCSYLEIQTQLHISSVLRVFFVAPHRQ